MHSTHMDACMSSMCVGMCLYSALEIERAFGIESDRMASSWSAHGGVVQRSKEDSRGDGVVGGWRCLLAGTSGGKRGITSVSSSSDLSSQTARQRQARRRLGFSGSELSTVIGASCSLSF
jgi:hypothetical protein